MAAILDFWLCPVHTNNAEWGGTGKRGASSIDVNFGLTNVFFMYVYVFIFYFFKGIAGETEHLLKSGMDILYLRRNQRCESI